MLAHVLISFDNLNFMTLPPAFKSSHHATYACTNDQNLQTRLFIARGVFVERSSVIVGISVCGISIGFQDDAASLL